MLTHKTANWAQSNMREWAKTDNFQTKLTQLLLAENIGLRRNLTKLYINILNIPYIFHLRWECHNGVVYEKHCIKS